MQSGMMDIVQLVDELNKWSFLTIDDVELLVRAVLRYGLVITTINGYNVKVNNVRMDWPTGGYFASCSKLTSDS